MTYLRILRKAAALVLAATLLATTAAVAQLTSDGRYKGPLHQLADPPDHPSNRGINTASFGAQRQGPSVGGDYGDSFGGGETFSGTPVGYWALSDVLAGQYAIAFSRTHEFPRAMFFNLDAGAKFVTYRNAPEYYPSATFWRAPALFFGQQFQALGTSVTSVSARVPNNYMLVRVTIHDGDINGPQIGPARVMGTSYADDGMACWSAGEVPTTPGHYYTAKFVNDDDEFGQQSLQLFFSPGRCLMGDYYYGGKSWIADANTGEPVEVPDPIKTVIGMDTDGITSTVHTSTAYLNAYVGGTHDVDIAAGMCGQSFVAKGTSVLGADFRIWNPCIVSGQLILPTLQVAVFQGPGSDGGGANQIGPTKYTKPGIGYTGGRTVVTWYPGEVPVTPGQSYYMRISPAPNAQCGFMKVWVTNTDEYVGGQAYAGAIMPLTPQNYDLSCMILEETTSGSATMAKVNLTNKNGVLYSSPECTARGTTTATIEWATPQSSSTGKVEYSEGLPPYTQSFLDNAASGVHSVTLTGLKPATLYHCRITASAPGKRDAYSKDFAFVTEAETQNLLVNGDFETGNLNGWTLWGDQKPGIRSDNFIGGIRPHTGTYYVGGAWNSCCTNPSSDGGVYQQIPVNPNQPVTLRGWLYTYQGDPSQDAKFDSAYDLMCLGRVGIDPSGGTDPASGSVIWSTPTSGQDWYDPNFPGKYVDIALTVQPQSSLITVFTEAGQLRLAGQAKPTQLGYSAYAWDDLYLSQQATTQAASIGDLQGMPDGLVVAVSGVIVTAHPVDAGAHYVEAKDRAAGIRVESEDFLLRGTEVKVQGRLATKPSGERYLADATFPEQTFLGPLNAMFARNSWLGNPSEQLATVGLLMRTSGKVTSAGEGFIVISDGSSSSGLKVDTSTAPAAYAAGQTLTITGIVQLEGSSPETASVLLRARDSADVVQED